MFLDLDNFKHINDTLGHDAGDTLLIEASKRVSSCLRGTSTVARLGGDEFLVVLPGLSGPDAACQVADRILKTSRHRSCWAARKCSLPPALVSPPSHRTPITVAPCSSMPMPPCTKPSTRARAPIPASRRK